MTAHTSDKLLVSILLGITLGLFLGGFAPAAGTSVKFLGELFLKALFVMVVPLVMSSMIVGVSALGDVRNLGPLGGWTMLYFMATT
ncbi:MAG: cation:dicarboxylate symporter family transporter, partial [Gammaproteobacteria bacterium]